MTDKPGWQPIETAPKDGTEILVHETGGDIAVGWWSTSIWVHPGAWVMCEIRSDTIELLPTHWMPLPEPPDLTVDALVKAMEGKDGD